MGGGWQPGYPPTSYPTLPSAFPGRSHLGPGFEFSCNWLITRGRESPHPFQVPSPSERLLRKQTARAESHRKLGWGHGSNLL